jgi:hypothetical protein
VCHATGVPFYRENLRAGIRDSRQDRLCYRDIRFPDEAICPVSALLSIEGLVVSMNQRNLLIVAVVALAGGWLYFSRSTNHSPFTERQTQRALTAPPVKTVCVDTVQNLSGQPVNMVGVDGELVARLRQVGFPSSRLLAVENGDKCDAVVNAELVELSGRGRKTAHVDFRLTLAGEQPPRISSTATGKSSDNRIAKFASSFRPAESTGPSDQQRAEREAVFAAIEQQALQIQAAYQRGLPPWLPNSGSGQ